VDLELRGFTSHKAEDALDRRDRRVHIEIDMVS
jgi:hypothetical protein